ncbi:MAG: hypothetical protein EP343_05220 [Deltaproteobacteria bacterium]|nr:MAG: hypothetical protein EP343_05220 [Deltaproteobacteria bacterium]
MFRKVCMTWLSGLCFLSLLLSGCGVPSLVEGLGQVKWEGKLTQQAEFPPLLANGMLFVAGQSSLSAWDARTGKLAWSHDTNEHTWSGQPVVSQGTLLLGTQGGKVIGLDPTNGETLWSFQMENSRIFRAPVLHGNIACFMGWKQEDRTLSFYGLDIQKQALAWQHDTTYSPSVQDGTLTLGRPAISGNTVFFNVWGLAFFAFDATTGNKVWTLKLPKDKNAISSKVETSPLVAGDLVLFGSTSGLYAINGKTGQQKWHAEVAPTGHLTHEEQIVYVPGHGSGVTALYLNTGKTHWQASTTSRGSLPPPDTHTPPLLIGPHIYVAHLEGEIDIVDKNTGQPLGKYRAAERPSWVGLATDGATLFVVQDKSILAQAIHSPAQP